ncbi:4-(cytidine 5'-diphospho)-2-C-methyl-D-erythritol kinase [Dactylosporangium sp. AC04546]|uniref:4-(cytidine 5'-diphospho)-2-C-methyl-D-erythritol kinase n=1 Tax=Dactylosporangium sp. AC04546 TaxID=2862460 RepID=UPI001EDF4B44|nr:4-(cytidine 5'-diphospho)-2-C-methyl-D-erythritol kinase [Dactylosporangium sp. AC04546]WVK84701.1 4-(cytidine 5'-diphospho)-2-C-methyl-D-erythritol kinase [Dactylosporangium sp. AC04546]
MTEPLFSEDEEFDRPRLAAHGPVRVRVPAKINLHLHVGPARSDGFHELTTVYHAIGLYDEVTARRGDTLTLTMEGEGTGELSLDEDNLVIRAARALAAETGHEPHARLHLKKQIPIAAGLAGGSADAAAALVACDQLWGTGMSRDDLAAIAATLGSDIPFLVLGGTALGTGRGELVSPVLTGGHTWHWVLAVAEEGLSTPTVYRTFDQLGGNSNAGTPDGLLAALRQRDPEVLAGELANDLQAAALHLRPELQGVLDAGLDAGALAGLVSGSGPTCVFLAEDARHAALLAAELESRDCCRAVRTAVGPVPGARVL